MAHLSSAEFVDSMDGVRDAATARHLALCGRCRQELADLRETMTAAVSSEVPEPSPLFWNHLSARVREAIEHETLVSAAPRGSRFAGWWLRAAGVMACGLAVVVVATVHRRGVAPVPAASLERADPQDMAPGEAAPLTLLDSVDDPSLNLVADVGGMLDWDDVREQMAVSSHPAGPGDFDATVSELDRGERQELERLLKEELARPPAQTGRS
jgi:hypothetical protein